MKIYVASSWRNHFQPEVVKLLKGAGYDVYDFKNPAPGNKGFHWSEIDPDWKDWTPEEFKEGLKHPLADKHFDFDMKALEECDACVLVLPSGRSAHLEAGHANGAGKLVVVYCPPDEHIEPELMYKMTKNFVTDYEELLIELKKREKILQEKST